jgi:acetyl esterase
VPPPEVRRFLESLGPDEPDAGEIPLLRRRNDQAGMAVRGQLVPVLSAIDSEVDGIHVRRYQPADADPDLQRSIGVIWVHGGGWFHGTLDVYENVARGLANALRAPVIAVDYRLAPENPFPAGLDDVWTVVLHAAREFETLIVAGDSSGGNLAAAVALRARDKGVRIATQLLIYPVLDSDETPFKRAFRDRYTPFLNQAEFGTNTYNRILRIWQMYEPDPERRAAALATPMRAEDLRGVAPAVIVTAEHDILRGEAEHYAQRLRDDGVPIELLQFPGQIHGFIQMRGVFPDAARALESAADAVRRLLGSPPLARSANHPRQRSHRES